MCHMLLRRLPTNHLSLLEHYKVDWRGLWVYKTSFYLRTTALETSLFLPTSELLKSFLQALAWYRRGDPRSQAALSRHTAHTAKKRDPAAADGPFTPHHETDTCLALPTTTPLEDRVGRRGALQVCQILGVDPRPAQVPAPLVSAQQVALLLAGPGPLRVPSKESRFPDLFCRTLAGCHCRLYPSAGVTPAVALNLAPQQELLKAGMSSPFS